MFDLKMVLQNLKEGMKVPEEYQFLKKYDTDGNSIFDSNEIQELSDALTSAAASDGNAEDLSDNDLEEFFISSINSESIESEDILLRYNGKKHTENWLSSISKETEIILKKFNEMIDKENLTPIQKQLALVFFQNKLLYNSERFANSKLLELDIQFYINFIKERMESLVDNSENNEDYKKLLETVTQFAKIPALELDCLPYEVIKNANLNRMNSIIKNNSYKNLLSQNIYGISKLLQLDDEAFKRAETFFESGLQFSQIADLTKIQNSKRLMEIPDLVKKIYEQELEPEVKEVFFYKIIQLEDKQYAKFKTDIKNFTTEYPNFLISDRNIYNTNIILKSSSESTDEHVFTFLDGYTEKRNIKYNEKTNSTEITLENFLLNSKANLNYSSANWIWHGLAEMTGTRIFLGEKDNILRTETTSKSGLIGLPNQSVTYADKQTKPVQFASIDNNDGSRYTEKHFVSPAGIETDYIYEQQSDGARLSEYKITNKNGQVIFNKNYALQKISENKFVSKINDKIYEVEFNETSVTITDKKTNKTHTINLEDKIKDKENSENIMDILKTLPANQLLMIDYIPLNNITYDPELKNNAFWDSVNKSFTMGTFDKYSTSEKEMLQNVFMHEFGHFLDISFDINTAEINAAISGNKELEAIYQKEYEEFIHNTDSIQQMAMNHLFGHLTEIAAEANMLVYAQEPGAGERAMLLQKYFPQTIAKVHSLFDEEINSLLNK